MYFNEIMIAGGVLIAAYALILLARIEDQKAKRTIHHDNRPGSYYYESNKKEEY